MSGFLVAACLPAREQARDADPSARHPRTLAREDVAWIQTALDGWTRVTRDFLHLDPRPLPWMLLFDDSCTWHLAADTSMLAGAEAARLGLTFAGEPVDVCIVAHGDSVILPTGASIPVRAMAFSSTYASPAGETMPFFVLALPRVWRAAFPEDSNVTREMLGVASHELVHTRQLVAVEQRIEELGHQYALPEPLGDDVVEQRYRDVADFRWEYEAETELFYRAVSEAGDTQARTLAAEALGSVRAREARYFRGKDEVFRELDALFLNLEGVAVLAAYHLSRSDPRLDIGIGDPVADRKRNSWSQDRGLALFLLIERWVPDWRTRTLGEELASPYVLLERVTGP